ncbi:class I SAM-dependent methyltransferase [Fluviibacterium sp. DFM31]|uniref:Class I SAM-dependent methyltransferase n=1 Tax=Meridianimarinicoccus marinus TaxID=3231483 RepID=A0ABV3L1S8_9RHOB
MSTHSHDQLMDQVYRYQRYVYDVTRKYYLLGRDQLIADLDVPPGGSVLEVACGTGRNLVKIGRSHPEARLYGLDISSEMLTTARASLSRAGMAERARLIQADACAFDPDAGFGQAQFDRIVLSYSLSMIPDWQGALRESLRHLAPGGQLHVVDFGQSGQLPSWFFKGLQAWLEKFHVTPRADLEQVLTGLARDTGGTARVHHMFRGYAVLGTITHN